MIERFTVQNFKALKGVSVNLTPMHLLIGPNDSGKTSILEAVSALARSADYPLADAFLGPWEGRELVWMGSDSNVVLQADDQYDLAVEFPSGGRSAKVAFERVFGNEEAAGSESTFVCSAGGNRLGGRKFSPVATNMHAKLSGVHSYRWIPELLSLPCAAEPERTFRMESHGFGLALCLDDILGYDRSRFGVLESRYRKIFPQVRSLKLQQSPAFRVRPDSTHYFPALEQAPGKGLYFDLEGHSQPVPARQISDGMLLVLAYLAILYLPAPPHFLLVEEPENGIHPARLKDVLAIVRELAKEQNRTQVIMTTHSPYVVDLFSPHEVTICHKVADGSVQATRLSDTAAVRDQKDIFTLGEIWTGEGDEALARNHSGSNGA